jgi:phosphoribosylformylglycinamidine synthase
MAGRGGTGIDVHLDRVPLREPDLEAVEIMLSESQERMVAVVAPEQLAAVEEVCARWELRCADIGVVTDSGLLRAFHAEEEAGAIPVGHLTDETPRYRLATMTRELAAPIEHPPIRAERDELLALLASPNIASRAPVFERYDQLVGSRTVRRPGLDAAVLRLRPSLRGLAVALDGPGRASQLDPRTAGARAVFEAARNVACTGARPLAVTDCLNFGNPEKPEVAWELVEAIEGMARACELLGVPVVSGNVSLYNETDGRAIHPTPVVGCVGLVADVRSVPGAWREGDVVLLAGDGEVSLDGSEYQARFLGGPAGRPPPPRYADEGALVHFLWRSAHLVSAAHDLSDGGLAVALAELALHSGLGAEVDIGSDATAWFGEGAGRAVVACAPDVAEELGGVPLRRIGVVGGGRLLGVPLAKLRRAHEGAAA